MKRLSALFNSENISKERKSELLDFCRPLGLHFNNLNLLDLAFHHRSSSNESHSKKRMNNERLEFLGDSVLGMVVASFLYEDMEEIQEGELSKIKAMVVSEKTLAPIALEIGIDKMLVFGHGEEMSGGRTKPAILADCMEAVIAAYFLDSGYAAVEKYVLSFIVPEIRKVQENKGNKDFKTLLQEYYQKKTQKCPVYELVKKTGPDHDQIFYMKVKLGNLEFGPCEGKNKKEAEQKVAEMACIELKINK